MEYTTYIGTPPIAMTTRSPGLVAASLPSLFDETFENVAVVMVLVFAGVSRFGAVIPGIWVVATISEGGVDANVWLMYAATPALHVLQLCLLIFFHNFWKKLIVGVVQQHKGASLHSRRTLGKVRLAVRGLTFSPAACLAPRLNLTPPTPFSSSSHPPPPLFRPCLVCAVLCWALQFVTNSISKLVVNDMGLFEGSFVTSAVWWLLGADIDGDVYLDNVVIPEPDLLRIGEGAIVARGAKLWTHKLQDWKLDMERIVLGKRVNVGANCLICMDTHMGDDSVLGACSVLMQQQTVKENELYFGNPADRISSARAALPLDAPQQRTLLAAAPPQR